MSKVVLLAVALLALAPSVAAADTQTDLVLSGSQSLEMTASDANACYFDDDNVFNGQLTDSASGLIISINILGTAGDHPALASDGHAQLTMLGMDPTQDDPFINWSATGGTVTLDDPDTSVPVDDGSASTHGVLGHIKADLTSRQGTVHIEGPFACHLAG
jgi:hypothetical protein